MTSQVSAVRADRVARTRGRLHDAVAALAERTPLSELDVAGVCREAGVSRDTFYRYFASVSDAFASMLAARLDDALMTWVEQVALDPADAPLVPGLRVLVDHIADTAPLYRAALGPGLDSRVREVLALYLQATVNEFINLGWIPDLPEIEGVPDGTRAELLSVFAAAGVVGVLEASLRGDTFDRAIVTDAILAALPDWWFGSPPGTDAVPPHAPTTA